MGITAIARRSHGWRVCAGRLLMIILAAVAVPFEPAAAASEPFTTADVTFAGGGGVILHGLVLVPTPTGKRRPALVMLEGAGNRGRQELQPAAEAFARRGVITLIYDKRRVGYSLLHRDYGLLADDAIAAVALLAARGDVDPSRLGLWAQSEGAYVAPLACRRSSAIKFTITVGAVGVTPAVQTAWGYDQILRHAGVATALPRTLEITALRTMISAGLFPEANFDPVPAWQHIQQPVLAEWGEFDRVALPLKSSMAIQGALHRGGNTRHTMRFISGVRHNLNLTADGGFDRIRSLPADYGAYERHWIDDLARTEPSRLGTPPTTETPPPVLAPLSGAAAWFHLSVILTLAMAFAFYPLAGLVGHIRRRPRGLRVGRHPAPDRSCRLVHHARPPGLSAVLDDHGRERHRARGLGPSAPVAPATGVNGHYRRLHGRDRRQVVDFWPRWQTGRSFLADPGGRERGPPGLGGLLGSARAVRAGTWSYPANPDLTYVERRCHLSPVASR
jgi:hypothetical protein